MDYRTWQFQCAQAERLSHERQQQIVDDLARRNREMEEQIRELLRRRLVDRRISLVVTDEARDRLAHDGYDAAFGARPLKRLIQKQVGDRLAMALLEGKVADGDTVTLDIVDGGYELT